MTMRQGAFYRSPVVRLAFIISGAFLTYALSPWAPEPWHDTPSLRFLHMVLPYSFMAAGFAVYTLLLLGPIRCVIVADAIGLALYLIAFVALLVTVRFDRPTNPFAITGVALAVVLHFAACRLAIYENESA